MPAPSPHAARAVWATTPGLVFPEELGGVSGPGLVFPEELGGISGPGPVFPEELRR